jgi:PAS domain S-box-containing protein
VLNSTIANPLHILLIEDNSDDAFLAMEALAEIGRGCQVTIKSDGIEALVYLQTQSKSPTANLPDVILLDLDLPKKKGLEVLREIKENRQLRRIPVIIMTSSDDKRHLKEACNLQINGYITKPFSADQLRKAVHSIDHFWFSIILESLPDAVIIADQEATIILVNEQAERLFQSTRQEMLGKSIDILLPEQRCDEYRQRLRDCYSKFHSSPGRIRAEFETRGKRAGLEFPLQVSLGLLDCDDGILVASTMRDITEQKRTESFLRTAREESETIVQQRTIELQRAFVEQQVLLKEIHHRVKNNLQLISSMVRRQSRLIQTPNRAIEVEQSATGSGSPAPGQAQVLSGLGEIQSRIQSMALVHEMLYQSASLASIDFSEYLVELTNHLRRTFDSYGGISLRAEAEHIHFDIDTAVRCGLIVTELVSNSYKHAFPEGRRGEIAVGLHHAVDGRFTLIVSDDGVGFFQTVDITNTKSLGLQLVSDLVIDLDGVIDLVQTPKTTYRIEFTPIARRS